MENKIYLGLGIITIISGVLLAIENQLLVGISGSIIGVWLVTDNMKKIRAKKSE